MSAFPANHSPRGIATRRNSSPTLAGPSTEQSARPHTTEPGAQPPPLAPTRQPQQQQRVVEIIRRETRDLGNEETLSQHGGDSDSSSNSDDDYLPPMSSHPEQGRTTSANTPTGFASARTTAVPSSEQTAMEAMTTALERNNTFMRSMAERLERLEARETQSPRLHPPPVFNNRHPLSSPLNPVYERHGTQPPLRSMFGESQGRSIHGYGASIPPIPPLPPSNIGKNRQDNVDHVGKDFKEPKVAEPEPFSGSSSDLDRFIDKCCLVFELQSRRYPTDRVRITYMISLMKGNAFNLVQPYNRLVEAKKPPFLLDFELWLVFLKDSFGNASEVEDAVRQLRQLKQTGTASEFFSKFTRYGILSGWDDKGLIDTARRALTTDIRRELVKHDYNSFNFNQFRTLVIRIDGQLREFEEDEKAERRISQKHTSSTNADRQRSERKQESRSHDTRPPRRHDSDRYDRYNDRKVNFSPNTKKVDGPRGPLTEAEKQDRRDKGLCLYCGASGHSVSDCPVSKNKPDKLRSSRPYNEAEWKKVTNDRSEWIKVDFVKGDPTLFVHAWKGDIRERIGCLIDTGATNSFIRHDHPILRKIPSSNYKEKKKMKLIDNHPSIIVDKYIELDLWINQHLGPYPVRFDIADIPAEEAILGFNFFYIHKAKIDLEICEVAFKRPSNPASKSNTIPLGDMRLIRAQGQSTEELFTAVEDDDEVLEREELEKIVPLEFQDYYDIFRRSNYESLPPHRSYDHTVELIPGVELKRAKVYPLSAAQDRWLKDWIDKNRKIGHIEPSSHHFGSPVFLVPKKSGEFRLVTDFRALNNATVKNIYPLPKISTLIDRIRSAKVFSKFDMPTSYQLLRMREGDEKWTTILTRFGAFQSKVMREGMTNAGASFQYFMNDIFHQLLDKGVVVYIDDILVYSANKEEHIETCKEVFDIIRQHHLYLKPKKCEFFKEEVEFLGNIIRHGQVEMDPSKLESIRTWPQPRCVKDIQRFLGFANFYRRFIEGYAGVIGPLINLTKKTVEWKWTDEVNSAFEKLKERFITAPILRQFDPNRSVYVETDASDYALAGVASQRFPEPDQDDILRPVGFFSRRLTPPERNYTVHDKELLAVLSCFEHWRPFLIGNEFPLEIITDHKNLEYFSTNKQLSQRQKRWAEKLSDYNFVIRYRPGKRGGKPDSMTRRHDYHPGKDAPLEERQEKDNFATLLPPELWAKEETIRASNNNRPEMVEENDTREKHAREDSSNDPILILDKIRAGLAMELQHGLASKQHRFDSESGYQVSKLPVTDEQPDWSWTLSGLLRHKERIFVPNNEGVRLAIYETRHDAPTAGHPGKNKTTELIKRNFWWKGIDADIEDYVRSCTKCQRNKSRRHQPYGLLKTIDVPEYPWEALSMDTIEGLPESNKFNAILVIVDRSTKMCRFLPTTNKLTSIELAEIYIREIFTQHGIPERIISDRGSEFISRFWRDFTKQLGISSDFSTAFHPETDGATERVNQTIESYLRFYCNYEQDDWSKHLPLCEYSYNNTVHTTTGTTPFFAMYGYHPKGDFATTESDGSHPIAKKRVADIKEVWEILQTKSKEAQERAALYYDAKRTESPRYRPGDLVYLNAKNIATKRPLKKLDHKYFGPYKVLEAIGSHAYRIQLPATLKIHNVFHVNMLEPHKESIDKNRPVYVEPEPETPDNDFEVERIVDSRINRWKKLEYQIEWKGFYGPDRTTWERADNIIGSGDEAIEEFYALNPNKPRQGDPYVPIRQRV